MARKDTTQNKISLLKEIASTLTSTNNLDSITNLTLDMALGYTNAKSGSILLADENGDLVINTARGMNMNLMRNIRLKANEYIIGKAAKQNISIPSKRLKNNGQSINKIARKYKTKNSIYCPVLMKDKLLGVININDKFDGCSFTEDEFDLIYILADQTAIALEQARLISQLRAKTIELDERNKRLIDSDRSKTKFMTRISHELRTPMNSIKGAAYYLKREKTSKKERMEFINIISEETDRLVGLLDDLLNFSILEKKDVTFKKKLINLQDILDETISARIVKNALSTNNISINILGEGLLPDIIGEKLHLSQSFINIIDGLTRYSKQGDSIDIGTITKKASVVVEFRIKGRKIPDHELPLIFSERSLWRDIDVDMDMMKFYLAGKNLEILGGTASVTNSPGGIKILLSFPVNHKELRDIRIDQLMSSFLSFVAGAMNINKCSLMLFDEKMRELTIRGAIGINDEIIRKTRLRIGDNISGRVARENKPVLIEDIERNSFVRKKNDPRYNTKSLLCLPIIVNKRTVGVLNLNNKVNGRNLDRKDLYLASIIAERLSHIIEKLQDSATENKFNILAKGIDELSAAVKRHKKKNGNITDLVYDIMKKMDQKEIEIKLALYASKIYDLGITQIDENIISKSDGLSEIEKKIIKTHPFPVVRLIDPVETDDTMKNIILHHHERYDGSGYPSGLKGDSIPFISRVLAVVDSYTAMVNDRPYRKALRKRNALKQIKAGAGSHFDPEIVSTFTQVV